MYARDGDFAVLPQYPCARLIVDLHSNVILA
jgi:hypothetical protein